MLLGIIKRNLRNITLWCLCCYSSQAFVRYHLEYTKISKIEVYKLSHDIYSTCTTLRYAPRSITRGKSLRLEAHHVRYDRRKYNFGNRIARVWKSLPEDVAPASTVNFFKKPFNNHRLHQSMAFDWRSE